MLIPIHCDHEWQMKPLLKQNKINGRKWSFDHLKDRPQFQFARIQDTSGFTLTDLVAVLAILIVLTLLGLPALARSSDRRNAKMIQCLSNLRQIGAACLVYANEFNDWYPIWGGFDVAHPINKINGFWYYNYSYTGGNTGSGHLMPKNYQYGQQPDGGWDENLGYLYGGRIISNLKVAFCPAFAAIPSSPLYAFSSDWFAPGADPSITQFPSTHINDTIRSSYMFNPRLQSASWGSLRAYQKTSDIKNKDVFCMDYLANATDPSGATGTGVGVPFTPSVWAHWPNKGLDVLYTDGSAKFADIGNSSIFAGIVKSLNATGPYGALSYNTIFNVLQTSP